MEININEVRNLRKRLREINSLDLEKCKFIENGKEIKVPKEIIKQFKFIGLNNADFIMTNFYKKGFD